MRIEELQKPDYIAKSKTLLLMSSIDCWAKTLVTRFGAFWTFLVEGYTLGVYGLIYLILPGKFSPELSIYVFQPFLWLGLALLGWLGWRYGLKDHPARQPSVLFHGGLIGFGQVATLVLAGLVFGFGNSPYSHVLPNLLRNFIYIISALVGIEIARAYIVHTLAKRSMLIAVLLVTLFFTIVMIPPGSYQSVTTLRGSIIFIGERLLPTIGQNLLSTILAIAGGPLAAILYRGALLTFEWGSPILPNLNWFVTAFLQTIFPAFGALLIYHQFIESPAEDVSAQEGRGSMIAWAIAAIFALALMGFNIGLFGVHPSVIASRSMEPEIAIGDIVVVKYVSIDTVQVGDVVNFKINGTSIVHRVVEVNQIGEETILTTKGDANQKVDEPISAYYFRGKVIRVIPKIGWVNIFIRNAIARVI